MDLNDLMDRLQRLPDVELLRLHAAIDQLLSSPTRILAVRQRLHLGQTVSFWNVRDNRAERGSITRFKTDQVLVLAEHASRYLWVPYAAVLIDPDAPAPEPPPKALRRSDFAIGDTVSFEGRDLIQRLGRITRLNAKTATIDCGDQSSWRVSYALLRHVIDV
jgi:hypothetical protein